MRIQELEENAAINAFLQRMAQNMAKRAGTAAGAAERATAKAAGAVEKTAATAAKTATTAADKLAQQALSKGVKLEPITSKVWDKTANTFVERAIPIVNYEGRAIVVVNVDGVRVPFYLSTGDAGKKLVPSGRWYPIFGIGPDGWINKGSEKGIASYYNMPNLKRTAQQLDSSIGDIRSQVNNMAEFGAGKFSVADINQGLSPVAHGADTVEAFKKNAYALFKRLGAAV